MAEATDAAAELRKAWEAYEKSRGRKDGEHVLDYSIRYEAGERTFQDACEMYLPAVLDRLDALERERRWVPVSERLPDANINDWSMPVLCHRPGIGLFVDSVYRPDNGERFWGKGLEYDRWLPIPPEE